ncbi:MAG: zinc-binding dehydrogenase [Anaerolineaceae bacterium]|nr:zinc-binding dehydrogenase [Anaerolineaceae bacterium]
MKTETMRAMCLIGFGGTENLKYCTDLPVPTPDDDEVLIKVAACGVNNTDIWTREGAYGEGVESGWQGENAFQFPRIQGFDIVGRITAVGKQVSPARIGTRVMVNPSIYADDGIYGAAYIGSERDGGFAEYTTVPSQNALEINSSYSDAELATFMTSYMTAEHMLNRAELSANETILITGASGGVGSALIQLASLRGARVIAVISKGKEAALKQFDIEGVVFRGEQEISSVIRKQIGISCVEVVADIVAGEQVEKLFDLLCVGGRYVTAGAIAGPMVTLDWRKLYLKHLTVLGATMGTQADAKQIVAYVAAGKIKPLLAGSYALDELIQAQRDFKKKKHFGKFVIIP